MSNNSEQSDNLNQKSSETSQELEPPKKPEPSQELEPPKKPEPSQELEPPKKLKPIEFEKTRDIIKSNSKDNSNIVEF
ncbi:hypothetical protein AFK68_22055 [Hydrocoleum sp. CS-953]|uniref:hypothetical protein n=1 Tax=Hydrocoleum sp. CS-953 TaxID=1671698 RepID=UPI000B9B53F6|nr:hypothetical protein [Hydrocoleum sp. CS-953]OZH52783.1 hypothetical protein AFK68_22055 [Hydrocoleum sp. CS-953]